MIAKSMKLTFNPSTLLALSAITAPDKPAPTTKNLEKLNKTLFRFWSITKSPHRFAQFSPHQQTTYRNRRMDETYNKIVFLLQPVHPSPFLLSNLQTGFSCFLKFGNTLLNSSIFTTSSAAHLMPVLLGVLLVARLACPQYLPFPLLRLLFKDVKLARQEILSRLNWYICASQSEMGWKYQFTIQPSKQNKKHVCDLKRCKWNLWLVDHNLICYRAIDPHRVPPVTIHNLVLKSRTWRLRDFV